MARAAGSSTCNWNREHSCCTGSAAYFVPAVGACPFLVDRERCNFGGATFLRCRLGFAVLAMLSLLLIYSWPAGNKALALSGQLMHRASQRLKDTTRYVFAVCRPDGLSRFSEGFAMTVRVRLIHAQVRRLLLESGQWRADAWAAPSTNATWLELT